MNHMQPSPADADADADADAWDELTNRALLAVLMITTFAAVLTESDRGALSVGAQVCAWIGGCLAGLLALLKGVNAFRAARAGRRPS